MGRRLQAVRRVQASAGTATEAEQHALGVSVSASLAFARLAVVWGLAAGSRVVLFDAAQTLIGGALS